MDLVHGFVQLLQPLASTMTTPTFDSLITVLTGWVFARRRTVTRMILAVGSSADKHYSSYHRVFSAASWSLDALGLAVFDLIVPHLGEVVMLGLDDTLARKRGMKMFGCGMHYDPLLSSCGKKIVNWGHSWVVLGVIVELPFRPGHYFCLPILFRLYLNKKKAQKHRRAYRKRSELAVAMLDVLCKHRKSRRFHVVADSAYGGKTVLCELPTPQEMLAERCRRVSLDIYGRTERARLVDCEARMYAAPKRPLRVVAVESLAGGRGQEAF